jgi:hypothetical protein
MRIGFERLQLAAARAVDDVPAALAQTLTDRVGLGEVALAAQPDAAEDKLLGFCLIRSSFS